ncbi:MAG: YidB family protein [Rubrivivax sp.]
MGLLDSVIGAMGQSKPGGGGQTDLMATVMALLGAAGGLPGLMQKFEAHGLGHIVQSWISHGENQPVTPDQLHTVLGADTAAEVSQQTGLPTGDAMAQLSRILPMVVDKLSPKGQVPDDGQGGLSDLSGLTGMLGGLFKP